MPCTECFRLCLWASRSALESYPPLFLGDTPGAAISSRPSHSVFQAGDYVGEEFDFVLCPIGICQGQCIAHCRAVALILRGKFFLLLSRSRIHYQVIHKGQHSGMGDLSKNPISRRRCLILQSPRSSFGLPLFLPS